MKQREECVSLAPLPSHRALSPFERRSLTVEGVEELGAYTVLRLADPTGPAPAPGQFAMLATTEGWGAGEDERPYLPRAFSFAGWRDGQAVFLLENIGPGTQRLSQLSPGESAWMLGPLGSCFTPPAEGRRALLVGGGIGIAPLALLKDALGRQAEALLGFRSRAHAQGAVLLEDARIVTDDGSVGHRGLVTDLLREELDRDEHVKVYACGPPAMLEAVRALCAERAIPGELALEAGMACGFGACFGCVVPKRDGGYLRVCIDGPVVDAADLAEVRHHTGAGI